MANSIERAILGDEQTLAYIQTESRKSVFMNILDEDILKRCANFKRVTSMYKSLSDQNKENGYILKVNGKSRCIAWWGETREKDMPGYAKLICIHSLPVTTDMITEAE